MDKVSVARLKENEKNKINNFVQNLKINSVNPATKLLEKRRMMYEVQEAFEQEKNTFKKKEETFKKRENELKNKDNEIQESLLKFSKYLTDIQSKTQRSTKNISELNKAIDQKKNEYEQKMKSLEDIKSNHSKMLKKLDEMKKFEDFLEEFKKKYNNEFTEVNDIILRHKVLKETNTKLLQRQSFLEKELESIQIEENEYKDKTINDISQMNAKMEENTTELEYYIKKKSNIQKTVDHTTSEAREKTTEVGQLLMAINNIYYRCKDQRTTIKRAIEGEKEYSKNFNNIDERSLINIECMAIKQINEIEGFLSDFTEIINKCRKELKHEKKHGNITESTTQRTNLITKTNI